MRFSLFFEHEVPRPWDEDSDRRIYAEALEQVQLADELGFDGIWVVQHHFLEEYSHSTAPEVFLGACAAVTKNVRLGHGIVPNLPGYNHPARVAEQISTLDIISGGRVEFGTGETGSDMELQGFGLDRKKKRAMWEEATPQIARMMAQTPYPGFEGEFFSMPERNVVPKPVQRPHPPIWVACSRRDTITMAGERGIGALSFAFINPDEAAMWVDDYYAALDRCTDPVGLAPNANMAVTTGFMCHEDEQVAIDRGLEGAHFFAYSLPHYYVQGVHEPGKTDVWAEFIAERDTATWDELAARASKLNDVIANAPVMEKGAMEAKRGCIGTPDQLREKIRGFETAGVDELIFAAATGKTRHEDICESMELFARNVMPEFKERQGASDERKYSRIGEALERISKAGAAVELHPGTSTQVVSGH